MSLRAIATFDVHTEGGVGNALASWFDAALAHPLCGRLEEESRGTAFFSASTRAGPEQGVPPAGHGVGRHARGAAA
ncbi:hypothetical protein [Streptomyces cyaneofuscatus]|uniref:hypothetical protein n=1 Tax=Streptomyces cyaneofuscatus TaxID=66883 RepID=UPI003655A081